MDRRGADPALEAGRLGAEAFGGGRLAGAGRALGEERLEVAGLAFGAGFRDGARRASEVGRLVVGALALGVARRVGVARVLGVAPGRVLNFGGVERVVTGFVSPRGRGRRVIEVFPGRRLPSTSPTLAPEPLGTARETGRPRPRSVTFDLGSSL